MFRKVRMMAVAFLFASLVLMTHSAYAFILYQSPEPQIKSKLASSLEISGADDVMQWAPSNKDHAVLH